jgi:hypothetical protein
MTLARMKEHSMKAKREQQSPPEDIERFREELGLKLDRLLAESLEAWATCDNVQCRRAKRCASRNRECVAKSQESLPPCSPEEAAQRLADFRRDLEKRMAGLPLDAEPIKPAQASKPRGKADATTANNSAQGEGDDKTAAPAAYEPPPLSPEKAAQIDQIWNDYVASLPAEEDKSRERRPRITQL